MHPQSPSSGEDIERFLKEHATHDMERPRAAPVAEFLRGFTLRPLSEGLQARVFRIEGHPWVVKEGRWDVKFQVSPGLHIPIWAEAAESLMRRFSFQFLPKRALVARQHRQYLQFARYFGYFRTHLDSPHAHPDLPRMVEEQEHIRGTLSDRIRKAAKRHDVPLPPEADHILETHGRENFLPREFLLLGDAISPENRGQPTFYVFQEYIEGKLLHDVEIETLPDAQKERLILLALLSLVMREETRLLPDTRPRYPLLQFQEWFTKTDNIIVTPSGLSFVDTRWFWEVDAGYVRRGLMIPKLTVNVMKRTVSALFRQIKKGARGTKGAEGTKVQPQ